MDQYPIFTLNHTINTLIFKINHNELEDIMQKRFCFGIRAGTSHYFEASQLERETHHAQSIRCTQRASVLSKPPKLYTVPIMP